MSTVTDTQGGFTLRDVRPPYSLTVIYRVPYSSQPLVAVFTGLTVLHPRLTVPGWFSPEWSALVTGRVTPAGPDPTGETTSVAWASLEASATSLSATELSAPETYAIPLSWSGPSTTSGNLHAIRSRGSFRWPETYLGYGEKRGVSVAAGATREEDLGLQPVAAVTVSGNIDVPANYATAVVSMGLRFEDHAELTLFESFTSATRRTLFGSDFSVLAPVGTGGTLTFRLVAYSGAEISETVVRNVPTDSTRVSISITPAPLLSPPADPSQVTSATEFGWTPFFRGVHQVSFRPTTAANPAIFIFTAEATTRMPDLGAQGLAPTHGALYSWDVEGLAPYASIDELVSGPTGQAVGPETSDFRKASSSSSFLTIQ